MQLLGKMGVGEARIGKVGIGKQVPIWEKEGRKLYSQGVFWKTFSHMSPQQIRPGID